MESRILPESQKMVPGGTWGAPGEALGAPGRPRDEKVRFCKFLPPGLGTRFSIIFGKSWKKVAPEVFSFLVIFVSITVFCFKNVGKRGPREKAKHIIFHCKYLGFSTGGIFQKTGKMTPRGSILEGPGRTFSELWAPKWSQKLFFIEVENLVATKSCDEFREPRESA